MPATRGSYNFDVDERDTLFDSAANLEKLRRLFRDGQIIGGDWGPGRPGDFDHGSWHVLCHLAGASGVFDTAAGRTWCAITHVPTADTYEATITYRSGSGVATIPLASAEGKSMAARAACVGFIEGTSQGHIAARGANDTSTAFNSWPRQMFDQGVSSQANGGTVWEHWSTTRDIRESSAIGTAVLRAWLTLIACLGGQFVGAVARGRREHSHPRQLVALVRAGVLTQAEALWDVTPHPIPKPAQDRMHEARPADSLAVAEALPFVAGQKKYFMFARRIGHWSSTASVKRDLGLS